MKNNSFYLDCIKFYISLFFLLIGVSIISTATYFYLITKELNVNIITATINQQPNDQELVTNITFQNKPFESVQTTIPLKPDWWAYPPDSTTTKPFSDPLLILISKKYFLPPEYEPYDLIEVNTENFPNLAYFDQIFVSKSIQKELNRMVNDALANGYHLAITSGYRSFSHQEEIFYYWVNIIGEDEAIKLAAKPGYSQHQQGTAVDLTIFQYDSYLSWQDFENHPGSDWLVENSWKYGFVLSYPPGNEQISKFSSEKWHYRYIGVDNAKEFHESGRSLQEWLEIKNGMIR